MCSLTDVSAFEQQLPLRVVMQNKMVYYASGETSLLGFESQLLLGSSIESACLLNIGACLVGGNN